MERSEFYTRGGGAGGDGGIFQVLGFHLTPAWPLRPPGTSTSLSSVTSAC